MDLSSMYREISFIIMIILLTITGGCSFLGNAFLEKVAYRPDINQGNYFTSNDVSRIQIGMTQRQITYILGTPMMTDPFGTNTWYYICIQQLSHKKITQKTLILTFNNKGILININYKIFHH